MNNHRNNQINQRIYDRNIPTQPLQPYIDARPVMTKYSFLPVVDPRKKSNIEITQMPVYNNQTMFNPGNTQSPYSGFASNINVESDLRNQFFALQKGSHSVYVPNSNSDLYSFSFQPTKIPQTHQLLFKEEKFDEFNPNLENIGYGSFYNSTRTQVKDSFTQ